MIFIFDFFLFYNVLRIQIRLNLFSTIIYTIFIRWQLEHELWLN